MQQLTAQELNQMFDSTKWPFFESVEYDFTQPSILLVHFNIKVDKSLKYFTGHFPEQAVLPGVVQIHWAGELARKCLACDGFNNLKKVKFNSVILPMTTLTLSLSYTPSQGSLSFVYQSKQQKYSSGLVTFLEQT